MANEEAPNRAPHTTPNLLFTSNTRAIESTFSGVASAQSQKKYILANISIVKHLKAALGTLAGPSTKKRDSASIEDSGTVMSSNLDSERIAPHPFHSAIWCPLDDVQAEFYRDYVLLHTLFWEKPLRLEARPTKMSNWRLPPTLNESGEPDEHGSEVDDISILRIPPAMFPAIRGELMLREVYQTLFEKLKERSGIAPRSGMTITGQPGIGKSLFLIYALAYRLSQGKPTVFYDSCDKKILLYNAHGVFTRSQTYINVSEHELPLGTWALINSTPPASAPSFLISKNSPFYIVLATSPNHAQDETWMFDRLMPTYYMTLWSWKEIRAGAELFDFSSGTPTGQELHRIFVKYGPSPTLVYPLASGPSLIHNYDQRILKAIGQLTLDNMAKIIASDTNINADINTHILFSVRPASRETPNIYIRDPMSLHILDLIIQHFRATIVNATDHLYHIFEAIQGTSSAANILFEKSTHRILSGQNRVSKQFRMARMVEQKHTADNLYSYITDISSTFIENFSAMPRTIHRYAPDDELGRVVDNRYYVPIQCKSPTFDSFTTDKTTLYAFQATVSKARSVSDLGLRQLKEFTKKSPITGRWKFVFVIPPGKTVECTVSDTIQKTVDFYTLHLVF